MRRGAVMLSGVASLASVALLNCALLAGLDDYGSMDATRSNDAGSVPDDASNADGRVSADAPVDPDAGPATDPDLVAHLTFDEADGGTSADKTGHGHTAVLHDAVWGLGAPPSGHCVHVQDRSGHNGYVDIPSLSEALPDVFPMLQGTVAFLYRLDVGSPAAAAVEGIFDTWDSTRDHVYARRVEGSGDVLEVGVEIGEHDGRVPFRQSYERGKWIPVVISWNLVPKDVVMRIGAHSQTTRVSSGSFAATGQRVRLLDDVAGASMDELRIYKRFMTEEEVKKLYP